MGPSARGRLQEQANWNRPHWPAQFSPEMATMAAWGGDMRACSPRTRTDFKAHLLWGKGPGGLRPWERHQLGSAHPGALASSLAVDLGPSWAPAACPQPQLLRHGQPHRSHLCSRALPGGPAEGQAGLPAGCWRRGTASTGPRSRGGGGEQREQRGQAGQQRPAHCSVSSWGSLAPACRPQPCLCGS